MGRDPVREPTLFTVQRETLLDTNAGSRDCFTMHKRATRAKYAHSLKSVIFALLLTSGVLAVSAQSVIYDSIESLQGSGAGGTVNGLAMLGLHCIRDAIYPDNRRHAVEH
jgi:hypothetical protein